MVVLRTRPKFLIACTRLCSRTMNRIMAVSREKLFDEVWAEPMTTVAKRYGISSSYLARVCERMNVPRPVRGYWARVEAGQAARKPPLPAAGVEHELEWSRDRDHSWRRISRPPLQAATAD